jgi:ribosomal protein S18 acetylase RimI-like enzyme
MLYRIYKPADFAELYGVEELCFQPPFRFGRTYMRQILAHSNTAAWIAEENGRIAGFAVVEWGRCAGEIRAYVQTIEVAPAYRGRGVGGDLLRRLEGSAREASANSIWLHVDAENDKAVRFYEANHYVFVDKENDYYPQGRHALVYGKQL